MNRIIYLTTAQSQDDFASNLSFWKAAPNTSNQNFHNKVIRALALTNQVDVISVRPINKNFEKSVLNKETKIKDNITWHYVKVKQSKIHKLLFLNNSIKNTIKVNNQDIILVDTLNLTLLKCAKTISKQNNAKIIGICTDSPQNISFISKNYKKKLIDLGRSLEGYVCLTEKINSLYNIHKKPYQIIDGINEEISDYGKPLEQGKYIYFGGSLMHEYGVFNLIKAFEELNLNDINLVICGHHEPADFKETIKNKTNIHYLGVKSYNEVANLEHYSLMAINPRPINLSIDEYSIPSKTLEFMMNGALTVCVTNNLLSHYSNCLIWSKTGNKQDLKEAILKALDSAVNREQMINLAKEKVLSRTSFKHINKTISKLF